MQIRGSLALLSLALVLAAACTEAEKPPPPTPMPTATPRPAFDPKFSYNACSAELPEGQVEGKTAVCGTLTVLENRDDPEQGTIELAVAILKASGPAPEADPLIYLSGGPGGPALEYDMSLFTQGFARPIQRERDIVFFDQRGVGRSEPLLDCPEVEDVFFDDDAAFHDALGQCSGQLRFSGVDLDAYNSIQNAADIADLARVLDYETYNLYGVSYGTRLALTAMRDAPDNIRSVILDSAFPLQANLYADGATTLAESLRAVFAACSLDPDCSASYGDAFSLEAAFFRVAGQLDASPIVVEAYGPGSELFEAEIDGDSFINLVFEALYSPVLIAELPGIVTAVDGGDTEPLELLASYSAYFNSGSSLGMYLSVQCGEEVPFNTLDVVRQATGAPYQRLNIAAREEIESVRTSCSVWNVARGDEAENEPVRSDIPTLVLAGEFDPITPPSYGRDTARTLGRSHFFLFRGFSHGVLDEGCPMDIVSDFLARPMLAPDAACVDRLPPFTFEAP